MQAALQQCLFYSFDCEFSGLSAGGKPLDYFASLQDRYNKARNSGLAHLLGCPANPGH